MTSVGIVGGLGPEFTVDYYRRPPASLAPRREGPAGARRVPPGIAAPARWRGCGLRRDAANTPHIVFDELTARSPAPLLSIVEVCAEEAKRRRLGRLVLLGTRVTMEEPFYATVCARHGIVVVTPSEVDPAWVHERYVGELLQGEFRDETRGRFVSLVSRLRDEQRIDGVILGGTELPLLLSGPVIADMPALDTTALHVAAIVKRLRSS